MKIFSWMQSKLQVMKKSNTVTVVAANNHVGQATSNEEFSDWPQSVLSIGTFGFTTLRSDPEESHPHTPVPQQVQEELISYLDTQQEDDEDDHDDDDDEQQSDPVFENRQARIQRSESGMFSRGKELLVDHHKNSAVIRKKSLTFLLKKIFTSRNKFHHVSLVRDSLPDPTFDKSTMEKILRTILNKKIHPQTSAVKPQPNKHLVINDISMDDDSDDENEGSTWVKTDSEYIVLEI